MKQYFAIASVLAIIGYAADCDIMCAAIYSVDSEKCECIPIEYMECHPQYWEGKEDTCNQVSLDLAYEQDFGRIAGYNPYQGQQWYEDQKEEYEKEQESIANLPECDLMCAMIYSIDRETCSCVPIRYMECHP